MAVTQRALLACIQRHVLANGPLALRYFRSSTLRIERKPDHSPVTAADRAIEARLRRALERICPGETIIGEEFGASGRTHSSYWTIDPIDGTRAFSRGLPSWGILVGHVERGRATLGVCHFPALGVTLGVAPGVAAYEQTGRTRRPLQSPGSVRAVRDAVIFHGGSHWWDATPYARGFTQLIRACYLERAYGDCYGYLWALRGCADAVVDYGVKIWDLAPLAALAQATGRALTDCQGQPNFTGPETIMAHPAFARLIAKRLRETA